MHLSRRAVTVRLLVLAAAASAAAVLALVPLGGAEPWRPSPTVARRLAQPAEPEPATTVLFVGDSYTAMSNSYAVRTCEAMGWVCNLDAQGSTGYEADGRKLSASFAPYIDRLAHDRANYRADVVFIAGGRNDGARIGPASRAYFRAVRRAYPHARVVVLSPFWNNARPPASFRRQRAAVKESAAAAGLEWIDTTDWLGDDLIGPDAVHPTPEGMAELARRLIAEARRLGI